MSATNPALLKAAPMSKARKGMWRTNRSSCAAGSVIHDGCWLAPGLIEFRGGHSLERRGPDMSRSPIVPEGRGAG